MARIVLVWFQRRLVVCGDRCVLAEVESSIAETRFESVEFLEDDAYISDVDGEEAGAGNPVVNEKVEKVVDDRLEP